jgi:hypothetical protein
MGGETADQPRTRSRGELTLPPGAAGKIIIPGTRLPESMAGTILPGAMAVKWAQLQRGNSTFELSNSQAKIPPNLF